MTAQIDRREFEKRIAARKSINNARNPKPVSASFPSQIAESRLFTMLFQKKAKEEKRKLST